MMEPDDNNVILNVLDQPPNIVVHILLDLVVEILRNGLLLYPHISQNSTHFVDGRFRVLLCKDKVSEVRMGKKLVQILMIIDIILDAILQGRTLMLRQLWYMQKGSTFQLSSPGLCNDLVRLICQITALPRHCLNIYAHCKGIFAGCIRVETQSLISAEDTVVIDNGSSNAVFSVRLFVYSNHKPSNNVIEYWNSGEIRCDTARFYQGLSYTFGIQLKNKFCLANIPKLHTCCRKGHHIFRNSQ